MPEDRQGTGKHPHKSTEEPYSHHRNESSSGERRESKGEEHEGKSEVRHESRGEERHESRSEQADLREREYRDKEGNVHHHTRTFEEQHGKEEHGEKGDKAA